MHQELTAERLREVLHYDPETGVFTWKSGPFAGCSAGCVNKSGYLVIRVNRRLFLAHRLAWLHMTGEWPNGNVDHKGGDKRNNRWSNLREASNEMNNQNQRRAHADSATGFLGIYLHKASGRYAASIHANGKKVSLKTYETPEEAHAAYLSAKRRLHEGCTI
jgi:hypothetical protein